MKRKLSILTKAVVLGGLTSLFFYTAACSLATQTIDVDSFGPVERVDVYQNGKRLFARPLAADSEEGRSVIAWIKAHDEGWRPTNVTYAPGRCVRGTNFNLNFVAGASVLNYRANDAGQWAQLMRPVGRREDIPDVFALVEGAR